MEDGVRGRYGNHAVRRAEKAPRRGIVTVTAQLLRVEVGGVSGRKRTSVHAEQKTVIVSAVY